MHLKVRFADFSLSTRSQTMPELTNVTQELWQTADELFCHRLPQRHLPLRLIGMGVSGLDDTGTVQRLLFDQEERHKQTRLDIVADQLKDRFGTEVLRRGSSLERNETSGPD